MGIVDGVLNVQTGQEELTDDLKEPNVLVAILMFALLVV